MYSPASPNTGDQLLLSFNISQLNFLTSCVQKIPTRLSRDHWDHILCAAVKWIQVDESYENLLSLNLAL